MASADLDGARGLALGLPPQMREAGKLEDVFHRPHCTGALARVVGGSRREACGTIVAASGFEVASMTGRTCPPSIRR